MAVLIDKKATVEEVDSWFLSTPQEDRIPRLARTIGEWDEEDSSRLRLDERLSQEEIVELLQVKVVVEWGLRDPVIHRLVLNNQTSTLISLLDRVTPQHLISLFRLKDCLGLNVLGWALYCNRSPIPAYVVKHLGIDVLYNLLCERRGWRVGNQLYGAVERNRSISEVLSLLADETRVHHLLSIRDNEGRSVLSYSIYEGSEESFQSIIRHYTGKQAELLELAVITDNKGHTSFHHAAGQETSNYLTDLIKATCSLETREELANALSMRNNSGGKKELGWLVEGCHSDNEFIYDWASDSLTNHRYLLFDLPSVLIMYNTAERHDADEEATSLEKCFTDLGFKVKAKSLFTKTELFEAIKDHQTKEASRNGQIVALMSHGSEGYITDSDDKPIPLKEIERRMCPDSHRDTPKLLILQCCQSSTDLPRSPASGNTLSPPPSADPPNGRKKPVDTYCPRHRDFCALTSTGPGTYSERNTFIPFLAKAIRGANVNYSVSQVMGSVKRKFPVNIPEQAPYCLDGLKFDFCIKSILPVYLSITRKTKSETAEGRQQDPTSSSESDADRKHLEPAPSSSTSNANHGKKRHREDDDDGKDDGNGAKRKKITAASSQADTRVDPIDVE